MDVELAKILYSADNYRDFLTRAFVLLKKKSRNFSYSYFSKKAGFSSRSFPRDVASGRKSLGEASLAKFIKGFGFHEDEASFFSYLVMLEEGALNPLKLNKIAIKKHMKRIAERRSSYINNTQAEIEDKVRIFQIEEWPKVYASLHRDIGSTLDDVVSRTGLNPSVAKRALEGMAQKGIISLDLATQKYCVKVTHLFLEESARDLFFKRFFVNSLDKAKYIAENNFVDPGTCFFNSTFTVHKNKMPSLCDDLRALLNKYVDSNEADLGDSVVSLTVAFWNEVLVNEKKRSQTNS